MQITKREETAQKIMERALRHTKILPYSKLSRCEVTDTMNTWAVRSAAPDSQGRSAMERTLFIGKASLDVIDFDLLPAIAAHEAGHTVFTWFAPNGMYLRDDIFSQLHNVFEDGRINRCLGKNYPHLSAKFNPIYEKLRSLSKESENTPYCVERDPAYKDVSLNPIEVEQIEWFTRFTQMMIFENGSSGTGRHLRNDPNWARTPKESIFYREAFEFYDAYVGVEPRPLWSGAHNQALHAKALTYLFGFDKYFGELFKLPPRQLPAQEELEKAVQKAKNVLPQAIQRLTPPSGVLNKEDEKRQKNLEADLESASKNILGKKGTHRDYGVCLAIIGLSEDKPNMLSQTTRLTLEEWKVQSRAKINERRLAGEPTRSDLNFYDALDEAVESANFDAIDKLIEERRKEVTDKDVKKLDKPMIQHILRGEVFKQLGHSRDMRLSDTSTPESKSESKQNSGSSQGGQKNSQPQQGDPNASESGNQAGKGGDNGKEQGGRGQKDQKSQSKPEQGNGQSQPNNQASKSGSYGLGHGQQGQPELNSTPTYEAGKSVSKDQLPYWIDSGNVPRKNEPEVLIRKPRAPGISTGTNGYIDIDRNMVRRYKAMIKKEFLSAVKYVGEEKEVKEESSRLGRIHSADFIRNDITEGRAFRRMFRRNDTVMGYSTERGEELAPECVVVLNDFSGSMHECAKELGAFSGAVNLLCTEKNTRLILALGSNEKAFFDSADPLNIFGEEGIIDTIEENFNLDNGGNSPTWHLDTQKKVQDVLNSYAGREHKVKVIVGSDQAINQLELEWLNRIKKKFATIVVSVKPDHDLIVKMGAFLRCPEKKPTLVMHDPDVDL